jgi:hypothetical protein
MTTLAKVGATGWPGVVGTRAVAVTGWALVTLALAAFGYEVLLAAANGGYRMIAVGELWYQVDVGSLNLTQAVIQRYVHPLLWDPVLVSVLQWPLWSLLGGPGAALVILSTRRAG